MIRTRRSSGRAGFPGRAAVLLSVLALAACGATEVSIPSPRPLVVPSGERLRPDSARLDSINEWVDEAVTTIREDPSFWIVSTSAPRPVYPWETMEFLEEDSIRIAYEPVAGQGRVSYQIYAYLHLLERRGELSDWFAGAAGLDGYELERFIVDRTADSWLLGRSVFDTQPYAPLDELVYAQDRGYLDALLLTAREEEFAAARESFVEENPGRLEEYAEWFRATFERDPPGMRGG